MSHDIAQNSRDIKSIAKSVYILIGSIEMKGVNTTAYLEASTKNNLPIPEVVNGLTVIKNAPASEARQYLMKHQGFTNEQASAVFLSPTDTKH